MKILDGKVAMVTGASRGIGLTIARAMHDEGATVVLTDIDSDGVKASAASLDRGYAMKCDVTDENDVSPTVDQIVEDFGKVDVAVANAGVGRPEPFTAMSLADWRRTTAVNIDGVFLTLRYAGAAMASSGSGGSLITMSSVYSYASTALMASYAASKAAVLSLTKSVALELRGVGVRANAICPGFLLTDLLGPVRPDFERLAGIPDFDALIAAKQGRYGKPEEIAKLAVFLASDRASWATGCGYILDGGLRSSML
jgi:NAD(P)-dependent dehydrogenase (short-subunit alcohol dehydrogenase family)